MLAVSQTVWVGHSCPTMPTVFQSRPQLRPRNQVPYLQHSTPELPRISTVLTPSPPASSRRLWVAQRVNLLRFGSFCSNWIRAHYKGSREAAIHCSPGRKPWVDTSIRNTAPRGRKKRSLRGTCFTPKRFPFGDARNPATAAPGRRIG